LPEHELEGWQRGNRLGLRILCELSRRHPGLVEARGRFVASRLECPARLRVSTGSRRRLSVKVREQLTGDI
jgi:hypothetical protein